MLVDKVGEFIAEVSIVWLGAVTVVDESDVVCPGSNVISVVEPPGREIVVTT